MGYSQEHIEETRKRILECAGKLFRKTGYNGVGIDKIMNAAGLTRGGFYSHFKSKAALFEAVVAADFDFTNQVRRLEEDDSGRIADRSLFAIQYYLVAETRDHVASACTMATSAIDVAGSNQQTKAAFGNRVQDLVLALQSLYKKDGIEKGREDIMAMVSMCVGGMILARASDDVSADAILKACRDSIQQFSQNS